MELNLDEIDLTGAESKATYEEIRAYVKEQTGLPKSEDSRLPNCLPEKEKAIQDIFEHFAMI